MGTVADELVLGSMDTRPVTTEPALQCVLQGPKKALKKPKLPANWLSRARCSSNSLAAEGGVRGELSVALSCA